MKTPLKYAKSQSLNYCIISLLLLLLLFSLLRQMFLPCLGQSLLHHPKAATLTLANGLVATIGLHGFPEIKWKKIIFAFKFRISNHLRPNHLPNKL